MFWENIWFLLSQNPVLSHYISDFRALRMEDLSFSKIYWFLVTMRSQATQIYVLKKALLPVEVVNNWTYLVLRTSAILPGGKEWKYRHLVGCDTKGIIDYYGGKTSREFMIYMHNDHFCAVKIGFFKSIIGRHDLPFDHQYCFYRFKLPPLTRVYYNPRGGDWEKAILKVEARWIFNLKAHISPQA